MLEIDANSLRKAGTVLGQLRGRLQGMGPLMDEIAVMMDTSIQRGFDNEQDPREVDWAPLAESTIANRNRRGLTPIKKLTATGKGRKSIKVEPSSSQVSVTLPDNSYMRYHQTGTRKMPKRQIVPEPQELERLKIGRDIVQAAEDYFTPTTDEFVAGELKRTTGFVRSVFRR